MNRFPAEQTPQPAITPLTRPGGWRLVGHDGLPSTALRMGSRPYATGGRWRVQWLPTLLFVMLIASTGIASAQPPPGYYDAAYMLSGPALRSALHDIISPHTVLPYSGLWDDFVSTDERDDDPAEVWDIYSDEPGGTPGYLYNFGSDQCGSSPGSEGVCFNREHTLPVSWFNDQSPMRTDLFHIYPTDAYVNQRRGNLPYGEVGSADYTSANGTRTGSSITAGYSGEVCEPIDAFKGDLARGYFYMMTRYMDVAQQWNSDMLSNGDLSPWAEALLLQWHADDPVSPKEIERNNDVQALQHNRNPFIDNPQWAWYIWGPTAGLADIGNDGPDCWYAEGSLHRRPSHEILRVVVTDAIGHMVMQGSFVGTSLPLPELPNGVYIVRGDVRTLRFAR